MSKFLSAESLFYWVFGALALALFSLVPQMFFLIFAAYVFHILISSLSNWLSAKLKIPYEFALGGALFILALSLVIYLIYVLPVVAEQANLFVDKVPDLKDRFLELLKPYFGQIKIEEMMSLESLKDSIFTKRAWSQLSSMLSSVFFAATSFAVVLVVGVYFSTSPKLYREILNRIVPPKHRKESDYLFDLMSSGIKWWLAGRLISMALVAVLSYIALSILGVKLAFSLSLLAGFLSFIPNLGPLLSLIPAALMGLLESPMTSIYVIASYLIIQAVESYLVTPFITKKVVSLPPAWLISAQIVIGSLFGIIGLALTAPILVVGTIFVRQILIKEILNDDELKPLVSN